MTIQDLLDRADRLEAALRVIYALRTLIDHNESSDRAVLEHAFEIAKKAIDS